ncbi:hypothetical protein ACHQM5_016504 [Ranunculus cassubicifolius]
MVLKESMRLHPFVPLIPRESVEDVTIRGFRIPKKSRIIVNVWAIGRDKNVWSDNVEEFNPERFANNNIDLRGHSYQLITFGAGPFSCENNYHQISGFYIPTVYKKISIRWENTSTHFHRKQTHTF